MIFDPPLARGRLVQRYKRFLADITTRHGEVMTIHCPNTGAMSGCSAPGSEIWYSRNDKPTRKYRGTLELVKTKHGSLVGVNTLRANDMVEEALEAELLPTLAPYAERRREVSDRETKRRFDFVLSRGPKHCFVEVKSVTLLRDGVALFPDAPSARAHRHVDLLESRCKQGHDAVVLFCVQRSDASCVAPADHIDIEYGRALRRARASGVTMLALGALLSRNEIRLVRPLPVVL